MEIVATFANEDAARAFAAYLDETQGLAAEVDVAGTVWTVAVDDPGRAATARLLAERFPGAAVMADEVAPHRHVSWLTLVVAVAVLVAGGLTELGQGPFSEQLMMDGFTNAWWRIATPILLHFGFLHLFCNLAPVAGSSGERRAPGPVSQRRRARSHAERARSRPRL